MTSHTTSQLKRIAGGLGGALLTATALTFLLIDYPAAIEAQPAIETLQQSASHALIFGLASAAAVIALTERLRLRSVILFICLGALGAFAAAFVLTRGSDLSSAAYSGSALRYLAILATGIMSALAYWFLAGSRAGWRGSSREHADASATTAFLKASFNTEFEPCRECIVGWAVLGFMLFSLMSWASIDLSGLHDGLLSEAEARGKTVLESGGHTWAHFRVDGDRGIIEGLAPGEEEKRKAYRDVRTALAPVTGIPGIISTIDNEVVAKTPTAAISDTLDKAEQRESAAQAAIEAARIAAEAAKAAEAEANRKAEELARLAETKARSQFEEKTGAAEEDLKRSGEMKTREVEAEQQRSRDEQNNARQESQAEQPKNMAFTALDSAVATEIPSPPALDQAIYREAPGIHPQQPVVAKSGPPHPVDEGLVDREAHPINPSADFRLPETSEIKRDATLEPEERAATCERELADITSKSVIYFGAGSTRIRRSAIPLLEQLAGAIDNCGSVIVTVEGHTDKIGTDMANQLLSELRASAVRQALIDAGADETRVSAKGFSSSRPSDTGDTAAALALNRRIEFRVSGKFTSASTSGP